MTKSLKKTWPTAVYQHVVPFHDCDPLRIVWHGHYYKYLEFAREALFRKCRLRPEDLMGLGYAMVVIESRCRYVSSLRHRDHYSVKARIVDCEQRIRIAYEVKNLTDGNKRVARAWTTLVVTHNGAMLMQTPAEILRRLTDPTGPTSPAETEIQTDDEPIRRP